MVPGLGKMNRDGFCFGKIRGLEARRDVESLVLLTTLTVRLCLQIMV